MESMGLQTVLALVVGSLGGGFVSWWLESRSEHRRWVRDEKLRATSEFRNSMYSLSTLVIKMKPGEQQPPELLDQVKNSEQSRISLVAPQPVMEASPRVTRSVADWSTVRAAGSEDGMLTSFAAFCDRISSFTVAVRSDLGTGRKDNPKPTRRPARRIGQ